MILLVEDRRIVFKEIDKGTCVLVSDKSDYISKADKQISDKKVYGDAKPD